MSANGGQMGEVLLPKFALTFTPMRWLFCMLVIVVFGTKTNAQIQLQNPSMEGTPCLSICGPDDWLICNYVMALDTTFYVIEPPHGPYDGLTYVFLEMEYDTPAYELGTITQKLPCTLKQGSTYSMTLQASSMWYLDFLHMGYLQLYGGNDTCSLTKLLWQSTLIDTMWTEQHIVFTPDSDYQWIGLQPYDSTLPYPFTDIAIDALSPIYLINANQVNALSSDTAIYAGNCISLEVGSTNISYDSLYWINATTNTTFSPNQWNTLVCPDSSTMYFIAMRDSVPDCAGYKWSYDTIRVQVIDTTMAIGKAQLNSFVLSVYPNPAKETVMIKCTATDKQDLILQAVNPLGQVMYQQSFSDSQQLNVAHWPAGMYCFTLSQNGQPLATARFLKE